MQDRAWESFLLEVHTHIVNCASAIEVGTPVVSESVDEAVHL